MKTIFFLIPTLFLTAPLPAADGPNFADDVLPILRTHCVNCHRPGKTRAGLDLTTVETIEKGGSSGASVQPGIAENSILFRSIAHIGDEEPMPPEKDKLSTDTLAVIKQWIEGGLKASATGVAKKATSSLDITIDPATLGAPKEPIAFIKTLPPIATPAKLVRPLPVSALAANPWAPLAAIGGHREATLYDLSNGQRIGSIAFEPGDLRVLRFSRNGRLLLMAGGKATESGKAVLIDITTGKTLTTLGEDFDIVLAADLSPDQSLIALGGPEKLVRVYRVADGSLAYTMKKHSDFITGIQFSPDGKTLASADRASGLYLYPAATGAEPVSIEGAVDGINDIAWRADGKILGLATGDGSALLVDLAQKNIAAKWIAHERGCLTFAFAKDGRILTGGHDATARAWKPDGTALTQSQGYEASTFRVAFTQDDTTALTSDWTGQVRQWTLADGKEQRWLGR